MSNLDNIANMMMGLSLTPNEAEQLTDLIKTRTNANVMVERLATRAEVDALARSTKQDFRNQATVTEALLERIAILESILRPERYPNAGNGGGGWHSPRIDKLEAKASAALDVARKLEAQPTVDMKPARETFQSIRSTLEESGISAGRTDAEAIFAGVPDSRVMGVINARELNSADMRRAVPIELLELAKQSIAIEADLIAAHQRNDKEAIKAIRRSDEINATRIVSMVRGLVK